MEVVQAFNPSTPQAEAGESLKFEGSLAYTVISRIARATLDNPVLKKTTTTTKPHLFPILILPMCASKKKKKVASQGKYYVNPRTSYLLVFL